MRLGGCNQNFDFPAATGSGSSVHDIAAMANVSQLFAVAIMEVGLPPCVG